ncbi:MAG: PH domain-containing protein [Euryarchaeota archaeon]|nr:PH domain-containing protein [Euryarchaeota archaeon]
MKLALKAVPYRALQKTTTLLISAVFIASIGVGVPVGPPQFLAVAVGSFLLSLGYEVAYYRRFEYELTDDTLDIRSGVFNRREREIPYGRVQNVDISRNIFQRLVGLSKLDIETAGGGSTEASLKYVTAFEANRLQLDIRRYKRGESPESHAEGATVADTDLDRDRAVDDEELLFEIAPSELALAGILSFDPRVPGALIALFTGSVPFISPIIPFDAPPLIVFGLLAVLFAAGLVLAWIVGAISAIVNYWGFRLTRSADELRYERGLLQRYSGTIPLDKIQAITITDNPLKRRAGYATLVVETAGYAPGQTDGRGSEAAVPIGSRDRVDRLADEISSIEEPTFNRPPKRIRRRYLVRYLLAIAGLTGLLYAGLTVFDLADAMPWYLPAVAALGTPLAAHYKWLHRGYWLGEDHLVTRNGFWSRETKQVAYYRIQTVIETRTIFQRRWSVATVIADTAGSLSILGTGAAAVDIDQRDATKLRETLTERLRTALAERRRDRQRSTAFEWVDAAGEERSDSTGVSGNGQDVDPSDDGPSDVDRSDDDSPSRE